MKLAHYQIREAVSQKDWPAAVAALASHFGITMPHEYRMDIMRGTNLFQVEVYFPDRAYAWCEDAGFDSWLRRHSDSPSTTVDIWIR